MSDLRPAPELKRIPVVVATQSTVRVMPVLGITLIGSYDVTAPNGARQRTSARSSNLTRAKSRARMMLIAASRATLETSIETARREVTMACSCVQRVRIASDPPLTADDVPHG
jgi:hypothetical protein